MGPKLRYKIRYETAAQKLHLTVVEGQDIPRGRTYVRVFLMPGSDAVQMTKDAYELNPSYNDNFSFVISPTDVREKTIVFRMWGRYNDGDMGEVQVPLWLPSVDLAVETDRWEDLGEVTSRGDKKPILRQRRPSLMPPHSSASGSIKLDVGRDAEIKKEEEKRKGLNQDEFALQLDYLLQTDTNSQATKVTTNILQLFGYNSFVNLIKTDSIHQVLKDVVLLILHLVLPEGNLKEEIQSMVSISVATFRSLMVYIEALANSGVEDKEQGMLIVLGNSSVGKTSLCRTIANYCKGKCERELSFLTQDTPFIETKVVEVLRSVSMKATKDYEVTIHKFKGKSGEDEHETVMEEQQEVEVNVFDMGGHSSYYISTALFMKSQGIFMINFNGKEMLSSQTMGVISPDKYQQTIGAFIDLAIQNCDNPCIRLVATQMDSSDGQEDALWKDIWKQTAKHLKSYRDKNRQIILVEGIINTSAKEVSEEKMSRLVSETASLILNTSKEHQQRKSGIPRLWRTLVTSFPEKVKITRFELQSKLETLKSNGQFDMNIDKESLELLEGLKQICKTYLSPDFDQAESNSEAVAEALETDTLLTLESFETDTLLSPDREPENPVIVSQETATKPQISQRRYEDEELTLILETFSNNGEILWFRKKEKLKNYVIPDPMRLVAALRCVINHQIEEISESDPRSPLRDLLLCGKLNAKGFKILYDRSQDIGFSEEELRLFLQELGLAWSCNVEENTLFVPSLISDRNEDDARHKLKEMKKDPECLKVIYILPKKAKDCNIFHNVVTKLTSSNCSIRFKKAFSQKIESRKCIGEVAAIFGSLEWKADKFEFCLADVEKNPNESFYSTQKGLEIFLKSDKANKNDKELHLKVLREVFHQHVQISSESLLIGFLCNQCGEKGRIETFEANSNLELEDEVCSMREHEYCKNSQNKNMKGSPTSICMGEHTFEASESISNKVVHVVYNQNVVYNQITEINIMNQIIQSIPSELTNMIDDKQKQFLKEEFEQGLTNGVPSSAKSLIKLESILNSVCMISGESNSTGFLVKLVQSDEIAFMSAGHCFKRSDDFSKYTLTFGNIWGDLDGKYAIKKCTLDELGPFKGSIGYNRTRQFFPGNDRCKGKSGEDYCFLVLSGMTSEDTRIKPLEVENLLECGHGDYLSYEPDEVLTIFGHPGHPGQDEGTDRPLRVCWGKEKRCKNGIIEYKMDTLPGNSGSPIIASNVSKCTSCKLAEMKKEKRKVDCKRCQAYKVKAIHVREVEKGKINGGQMLLNMNKWIPILKRTEEEEIKRDAREREAKRRRKLPQSMA